jgi:hypothetical protein
LNASLRVRISSVILASRLHLFVSLRCNILRLFHGLPISSRLPCRLPGFSSLS